MSQKTLYERIGSTFIAEAVNEFYLRAFSDPIIGHFFFNKDHADLTKKQISFASRMLGASEIRYHGQPLRQAHSRLPLTLTHFRRRQVLMAEVLAEKELAPELAAAWLKLEEDLRPLIINSPKSCQE